MAKLLSLGASLQSMSHSSPQDAFRPSYNHFQHPNALHASPFVPSMMVPSSAYAQPHLFNALSAGAALGRAMDSGILYSSNSNSIAAFGSLPSAASEISALTFDRIAEFEGKCKHSKCAGGWRTGVGRVGSVCGSHADSR